MSGPARISARTWRAWGGLRNPHLFRRQRRGGAGWTYHAADPGAAQAWTQEG